MEGTENGLAPTRAFAREFIDERLRKGLPQGNNVQFGPVGRKLWEPTTDSAEKFLAERERYPRGKVNLYVCPSPFCVPTDPGACGFCLFPHENHTGEAALERYVAMLAKEFRLLEPWYRNDELASVYFGGGTPNLLRPHQYPTIMGYVDRLYGGIPSDIEVTLEGLPQGFTDERKVRAMAECGINRISMGVQQIKDELIALSGRKQRKRHVLRALELARKYDLAHSLDLVCGWPQQRADDMLDDCRVVIENEVPHVTIYDLSIDGPSAFARRRRKELPSLEENRQMYHLRKELLLESGYEQVTVYDWRRIPKEGEDGRLGQYAYEQRMHRFDMPDEGAEANAARQVCGIGFAANTFQPHGVTTSGGKSWIYQNSHTTTDYYEQLERGVIPIRDGWRYSAWDNVLIWLFQSSQTTEIDGARYSELFGHAIEEPLGEFFDEVEERGWLERDGDVFRFVGDGEFYVATLQDTIAAPRRKQLRERRREARRGVKRLEDIRVEIKVA